MTTTDFNRSLGTIKQALAHLRDEKRITFEAFDAIMHFHILEVPDLGSLRHNFERREWPHLSGQLRSFANMRQEVLLNCVVSRTDPEELYRQGMIIQLLRELSGAAGSMGYGAGEMGN
jgi:hypothetical protein